jgi:hypothetical protein
MVSKWDQGKRYASKWRIPLYCLIATKQEKKPATGLVMVQVRGQELRRITGSFVQYGGLPGRHLPRELSVAHRRLHSTSIIYTCNP